MTTYTNTNFFDVLERPLDASLNPQPSTLNSLWTWSLQFEMPIWLIALLALGLALAVLWHLRASFPAPAAQVHRNRQAHIVNSILTSFR